MIRLLPFVLLAACGESDPLVWANQGTLTVGSTSCAIDTGTLLGFCLEGDGAYAVDGSGDCGRVTVWMQEDALAWGADFDLTRNASDLGEGEAATWVNFDDEEYTSTSGSARLLERNNGVVAVSFEAVLETVIGGDPGPTASGIALCQRP